MVQLSSRLLRLWGVVLIALRAVAQQPQQAVVQSDSSVVLGAASTAVASCAVTLRMGFEVRTVGFKCALASPASAAAPVPTARGVLRSKPRQWCNTTVQTGAAAAEMEHLRGGYVVLTSQELATCMLNPDLFARHR